MPWRREWLPTAVFWPENFMDCIVHGVGHDWATFTSFHCRYSRRCWVASLPLASAGWTGIKNHSHPAQLLFFTRVWELPSEIVLTPDQRHSGPLWPGWFHTQVSAEPLSTSLPGEHGTFLDTSHSPCDPEALHCCACCSRFPHLFVLSWYWRILTDRESDRKSCFNNAPAKTLFQNNDEGKSLPLMFYFQKSKTMFAFFQWKLVSEVSLP